MHRMMQSDAFSGTDSRDDRQGSTGWKSGFERQVDRWCPRDLSYFAQVPGVSAGSSQRDTWPPELLPPERFPRFRAGLRRPSLQILFRKLGVDRAGGGASSRRCPPSGRGGGPAPGAHEKPPWSRTKGAWGLGLAHGRWPESPVKRPWAGAQFTGVTLATRPPWRWICCWVSSIRSNVTKRTVLLRLCRR